MHPEVARFVEAPGKAASEKRFLADVNGFCRSFVQGMDFDDDVMLKKLMPELGGVWELRLTFQPQHRIFGSFLRKGEFVATNHRDRASLERRFAQARGRSREIWSSLFSELTPLQGYDRTYLLEDFDHASL